MTGTPIDALRDESRDARLLVVGSSGLNQLEGALAGSVAVAMTAAVVLRLLRRREFWVLHVARGGVGDSVRLLRAVGRRS